MNTEKLGAAAIAMTLVAAPAMADALYTTSFTSDATPVTGSADFSVNASGQLVLTLTNTTLNAYEDSQNLSGVSFKLNNFGSSTNLTTSSLVSISGNSISSTPLNTNVSSLITVGGATLSTTPWSQSGGTTVASFKPTGSIAWFSQIGSGKTPSDVGSIAGVAGSNNEYTLPASNCTTGKGGCGSSTEYGSNSADDPMIYGSATFVFNVTGIGLSVADLTNCTTGNTCISDVQFGYGPDGLDADDIGAGTYAGTTTTTSTPAPEPSTIAVFGLGLAGLWAARRRAIPKPQVPAYRLAPTQP